MLKFFRSIFKSKKAQYTNNTGYRHLKKIISGPKLIIDGKVFVRVKLRFVDTLDFNITQFVDRLETEIDSQRIEIEKLTSLLADNEKLIHDLQKLNVNLLHDNVSKPLMLNEKISILTDGNIKKSKKVADLIDECSKLKEKINQMIAQDIKYQNIIKEKDTEIRSLEQTNKWLRSSDKGIISLMDTNERLKKEMKATSCTIKSLKYECEKRDSMIQYLTKKIQDYEAQIYILETGMTEENREA